MEQENLAADFASSGNLKQDAPQGDFLVNALLTGALDATVVYTSNAAVAGAKIDRVPLASKAFAEQPFAMARQSDQRYLLQRLFDAVTSSGSQDRFTELGFDWRFGEDSQ
jgi:ABC-type molybdate transport system substrate-binding protein